MDTIKKIFEIFDEALFYKYKDQKTLVILID